MWTLREGDDDGNLQVLRIGIYFRTIDGQPVPISVPGGCCCGYGGLSDDSTCGVIGEDDGRDEDACFPTDAHDVAGVYSSSGTTAEACGWMIWAGRGRSTLASMNHCGLITFDGRLPLREAESWFWGVAALGPNGSDRMLSDLRLGASCR